jgi:HlyD family secretion protein
MLNAQYNNISGVKTKKLVRVLVVDDQNFICLSVKKTIESSNLLQFVGMVQDGRSVIAQIKVTKPDVIVLDLELPGVDSTELIEAIRSNLPQIGILVFSIHREPVFVQKAIAAGAKGYILKGCSEQELIDGIIAVYKGYAQLSQDILLNLGGNLSSQEMTQEDQEIWAAVTQENIEAMPRISLRLLLYVLLVMFSLSMLWLVFSRFEQVAKATGKLEPKSKVTIIEAPVSGKVNLVEIKSGQKVRANQTLLTLDSELISIEQSQQQNKLKVYQQRLNKLKNLKNKSRKSLSALSMQSKSEIAEKQAQIIQTQTLIASKKSELVEVKINLDGANAKLKRYLTVESQGALPQEIIIKTEQAVKEENQNVIQAQTSLSEAEAVYAETFSALSALIQAQNLKIIEAKKEQEQINSEILTVAGDVEQTQSQISALKHQANNQIIKSPVDGIIFESAINKPGAVVNVGEPLVSVAQEKSSLVFRGSVKSRDSGFLRVGLPAKIKLDAFPWREFGTVVGKIIWIAPSSRITSDQEEVFDVEIQVSPEFKAHLNYGQTGTAEIVTRVRSVIDFF